MEKKRRSDYRQRPVRPEFKAKIDELKGVGLKKTAEFDFNGDIPDRIQTVAKHYAALRNAGYHPQACIEFLNKGLTQFCDAEKIKVMENQPATQIVVQRLQKTWDISRDDVLAGFMDCVYAAATATELLMSWREIGKLIGAYAPKVVQIEHSSDAGRAKAKMAMLSEAELLKLVAAAEDKMKLLAAAETDQELIEED